MRTATRSHMKFGLKFGGVLVALEALLLWFAPVAIGTNEPIAVLQTRTATYTNVTITGRGGTNIYVRHSGGVSSIRIDELEPDAQKSLGYSDRGTRNDEGGAGSNGAEILRRVEKSTPLKKVQFANGDLQVGDQKIHLDATVRFVIAVWAAIAYLLFCYCALLICKKTGNEPGILIWLPILQAFPLLRAAGMSGWWFLAFLVPVLNLVAWLGWCVNIVISRHKNLWWALFLILPATNVLAFLYLAMASADETRSAGQGTSIHGRAQPTT